MRKGQQGVELWGGVECTVVRVGDSWRDQVRETGHEARSDDISRIAELGIRTVRYPLLWERIAPDGLEDCDFSWTDARLESLRAHGIRVIGGLLHHGSGPHYTSLVDPDFPSKLAAFAARVAERYPWIEDWTPVNEPLTTARFSGLYGHWYPHGRDTATFLRALGNQCVGTLEAMRAIRDAVPDASLIQTEDLGRVFAGGSLQHQADYENSRRWLSLDLLEGRIGPDGGWYRSLLEAGMTESQLEALGTGEAAPDIIGINHYLTSDRFLDERIDLYPPHMIGGNGRQTYADAEAVRVQELDGQTGIGPRLREAWDRYGKPLAITEVHHGCTRDEQLRWFAEVWTEANRLRAEGVDLRGVTLWSLFGNVDWRSLLTRPDGHYDTGVFDVRAGAPRPTAIAHAARAFAAGEAFDHPVLDLPGWWRRPQRLYPWHGHCKDLDSNGRKLLITGATGTLGQALARIAEHRGLPFCLTSRQDMDLCDPESIAAALDETQPWAVINTAGFVRVADAEVEQDACYAWNAHGAANLARACAGRGVKLVSFSSDLVFDGTAEHPYVEDDPTSPACVYGASKAAAEAQVLGLDPQALMIRTSAFFGPWDRYNFAWAVLATLARGEVFRACPQTFISPTFVPDLCHATLDLLVDGEAGLWHLANQGRLSWHAFAVAVADAAGLDTRLIEEAPAPVSRSNVLSSRRGLLLRPVESAIADYAAEMKHHPDLQRLLRAQLPIAAE